MRTRIALALRHKIIFAFILFLLGGLLFAVVTYQRHIIIQDKMKFVELADDLLNNALEVRRYEKNFLLYGGQDNFRLMMEYLRQTEQQLERLSLEGKKVASAAQLERNREFLSNYEVIARQYQAALSALTDVKGAANLAKLGYELRHIGRAFTESLVNMVRNERIRIHELVEDQKRSIFYSLAAYCLLAVVVAYYLFYLIFKPLSAIQTAAAEITAGNVRAIPPVSGSPEIQSLIAALNAMIKELDKKTEQLVQQEKMAALGTLTSGVAHELNNPLSNISSSTQIMLEELDEGDLDFQKSLLQGIEQQVEKSRDIVRSLLEFAREKEFAPSPVDVRSLIENTVKLVRGQVPSEVEVRIDIPHPFEIQVDQRRLSQALMNLIINGIQAMAETGGVLTVGAYYQPYLRVVTLEVSDTGIGIPEENLAKIFDPFFSTKDVGSGTGLGLYVTYGIIQKHHGEITVTSRPGQGSHFIITLPLKQPGEDIG